MGNWGLNLCCCSFFFSLAPLAGDERPLFSFPISLPHDRLGLTALYEITVEAQTFSKLYVRPTSYG